MSIYHIPSYIHEEKIYTSNDINTRFDVQTPMDALSRFQLAVSRLVAYVFSNGETTTPIVAAPITTRVNAYHAVQSALLDILRTASALDNLHEHGLSASTCVVLQRFQNELATHTHLFWCVKDVSDIAIELTLSAEFSAFCNQFHIRLDGFQNAIHRLHTSLSKIETMDISRECNALFLEREMGAFSIAPRRVGARKLEAWWEL